MPHTSYPPPATPKALGGASPGERVRVIGYADVPRSQKRKLLALGLTPGTEIRIERIAPLGDPMEIEVRGFHLGLRRSEADAVHVTEVIGE